MKSSLSVDVGRRRVSRKAEARRGKGSREMPARWIGFRLRAIGAPPAGRG